MVDKKRRQDSQPVDEPVDKDVNKSGGGESQQEDQNRTHKGTSEAGVRGTV